MSHYPLLTDRRFPLLNAERSYYAGHSPQNISAPTSQWHHLMHRSNYPADSAPIGSSFSNCWNALAVNNSGWPIDSSAQSSYRSSSSNLSSEFSTPSEYPESSQRTILPQSPHTLPSSIFGLNPYINDLPRSPSHSPEYDDKSWGDDLFSLEDPEASRQHSLSAPSLPAVKVEPDDVDDCFIMELSAPQSTILSQSLAPPTEVPLRATQASKEMRKMMGVFRLNPFAMHSGAGRGVVSSSWYGGEARPLDEEPVTFEFQLELDDPLGSPKEQLRPFSPDFELEGDRDEGEQSEWNDYGSQSGFPMTPAWELEYSAGDELLSSSESISTDFSSRRSSRLHNRAFHAIFTELSARTF
jgi:hypothetical protein